MGWETGVSLAGSAVQGFATMNNAEAQGNAMAATAENSAANIANKTSRNIGTLETSFLKGGIALGGAGTSAVFAQAGQQGQTDISRTIDNANASIANTMSAARTSSLNGIANSYSKLGPGTMSKVADQLYSGSWLQSAWNGLDGNPDPSPGNNVGTALISGGN